MPDTPPQSSQMTLTCNWQDWADYLAEVDATDAQKQQLVESLWAILLAFVDLGWDVGDGAVKTCGQSLDLTAALQAAVLHSADTKQEQEAS